MTPSAAKEGGDILVVKLSSMGDVIHALPAVHRLRELLPQSRIHWLVSSRWSPLLKGVECVDRVITVDRGAGAYLSAMKVLRTQGYQVALDIQGLLKSALFAVASGAGTRVGLASAFAREPVASVLYNRRVSPVKTHVVEQLMEVAEESVSSLSPVSCHGDSSTPVFGLGPAEDEVRWGMDCLRSMGVSPPFAVLLPGTGWETKTWTPGHFNELARLLKDRFSMPSVVVWGPGEERLIPRGDLFVAPPTSLREMMALLSLAALVVGGDTGPLHMAAALDVPVVGLYGPTLPERNGPYCSKSAVVVRDCPNRGQHRRKCADPCVEAILPEDVLKASERVLLAP